MNSVAVVDRVFFGSSSLTSDELYTIDDSLFADAAQDTTTLLIHTAIESALLTPLIVIISTRQCQVAVEPSLLDSDAQLDLDCPQGEEQFVIPTSFSNVRTLKGIVQDPQYGLLPFMTLYPTILFYNVSQSFLQVFLEDSLNVWFNVFEDRNPYTFISSHTMVTTLLTPLEIAQTRMAIQLPYKTLHKKVSTLNTAKDPFYYTFFSVLSTLKKETETKTWTGLIGALYHPRILVPSLFLNVLRPTLAFFSNQVVDDVLTGAFPISTNSFTAGLMYVLLKLGTLAVETAIVLPFEMAQKRLFIQSMRKKDPKPFHSMVKTRGVWYRGMGHVLGDVVKREAIPRAAMASGESLETLSCNALNGDSRPEWLHDKEVEYLAHRRGTQTKSFASNKQSTTRRWLSGVHSLFRGYVPRYAMSVVQWMFSEMSNLDSDF